MLVIKLFNHRLPSHIYMGLLFLFFSFLTTKENRNTYLITNLSKSDLLFFKKGKYGTALFSNICGSPS